MLYLKSEFYKPFFLYATRLKIVIGVFILANNAVILSQTSIKNFAYITSNNGLSQNTVLGIVKDKYGFMWFGTWNGLCRYDGYTFKTYLYNPTDKKSLNSNRIHNLKLDKNKNLWIRTFNDDELCRYNYEKDNFDRIARKSPDDSLFTWTDRRKHIAITNVKHKDIIWHIDISKNRLIETNSKQGTVKAYESSLDGSGGLNDAYVTDIYKDNHNILWIGTFGNGINKANLNAKPFSNYYEDSSVDGFIVDQNVTAICEDKKGDIWIGTRDEGITIIDVKNRTAKTGPAQLKKEQIRSIVCDSGGVMWIGTKEGVVSYNPYSGLFKDFSKSINSSVFSIIEDDENNLLLATWQGIYKYVISSNRFVSYPSANFLLHPHTRVIMKDRKGRIWVGCEGAYGNEGGISVLKPISGKDGFKLENHFVHNENKKSISDNRINCIYEDKEGVIWIGTGNGLDRYDSKNKSFTNISSSIIQFPKSSISAILEDNKGNLWISHKKGISQLNKKNYDVRTYTLQDGLQSNEFSSGAAFKSSLKDKLYFGGNNGLSAFDPDEILAEKTLPQTVLTELQILNKSVAINEEINGRVLLKKPLYLTKSIELRNQDKSISIEFAALHYSNPQANKYAYKLEGFDKEWVYTDAKRRFASYSNLDAGNYVFKVISSNSDGVWNKIPASLEIIVKPPFWASIWAYIFYVLLVVAILYVYHIYSTKLANLKSKLAYEAFLHEQEQNKLQFFTNISHEIKTPLTLILAPLERLLDILKENKTAHSQLQTIKMSGDRLLKLVNQLLDFRKLETGNFNLDFCNNDIIALLQRTLKTFEDTAKLQGIHLKLEANTDHFVFVYDEDKIEKVLYNLLSNALKFTPDSGIITIRFSTVKDNNNGFAVIEVINQGISVIEEEDLDVIFQPFHQGKKNNSGGTGLGLAFTKGLVEQHGGVINVSSIKNNAENCLTTFKVMLPLQQENIDFKTNSEINDVENVVLNQYDNFENFITDENPKKTLVRKHTLLIVEDNNELRTYLKEYFSEFYFVIEASNGKDGFDVASSQLPDLILSDVMMDVMDGFEFCSLIKTNIKTSHIPVILLTAQTPLESEIQGIETGADAYMTKPFNLALLEARIKNLLISRSKLKERYRKEISLKPTDEQPQSADEKLLQKLLAFIEENLSNSELGVEEICIGVGVSRSQLYRKVKDLTGLSISEILKEIRLKKAQQLLTDSKFTIGEIAYRVGFSDADYFRKCFKSELGMSPTDYMKKAASK
ncbi:hybrid sensor histidine kinase/response regulator transcription factor [Flavobacterium seoulense]|uniref:histidine kinase n=1 Tax=Flavobacterium seoulense TaxID=1492738 RepID=A0A066WNM1_9FLAO|nr:hybrid sensor histidine kinase/response regulator transcription factor [Flavobacterium seoulense]KDN55632.1 histidine kinase [Flavobacterium seoulense]